MKISGKILKVSGKILKISGKLYFANVRVILNFYSIMNACILSSMKLKI